jgi:uncharacterized membrane protein
MEQILGVAVFYAVVIIGSVAFGRYAWKHTREW